MFFCEPLQETPPNWQKTSGGTPPPFLSAKQENFYVFFSIGNKGGS